MDLLLTVAILTVVVNGEHISVDTIAGKVFPSTSVNY